MAICAPVSRRHSTTSLPSVVSASGPRRWIAAVRSWQPGARNVAGATAPSRSDTTCTSPCISSSALPPSTSTSATVACELYATTGTTASPAVRNRRDGESPS